MCIICNLVGHETTADAYLAYFRNSQGAMREATDAMLACSQVAIDQEMRHRYDATHKAMVRLLREWNALEHSREESHPPHGEKP